MLFDLRRLVATFTKHVGGYIDLGAIEASVAARSMKTRLVLAIVGSMSVMLSAGLAVTWKAGPSRR